MARVELTMPVLRVSGGSRLVGVSGASVQVNLRDAGAATVYQAATGGATRSQPLTTRYGRIEPVTPAGGECWVDDATSYDILVTPPEGGTASVLRFEAPVTAGGGGGTGALNVRTVTATGTILTTDRVVLADAAGGAITLTLPAASAMPASPLWLKRLNAGANAVTVQRAGSDTIDGDTSVQLVEQYAAVALLSDGTKWSVLAGIQQP